MGVRAIKIVLVKIVLLGTFALLPAMAPLSVALAAKASKPITKPVGACAQSSGRCVSDCDEFNWCMMNTCTNGQSTPVTLWRCYEPSGLCLAPRC